MDSCTEQYPEWMFWKKRRYLLAILAFFGFFNIYALRVNLSIAIVAMTEKKATILNNGTITFESEFDWDSRIQGYLLSSFFYGYMTTQLLGGWLSSKFGGKRIFGGGIAVTSVLTLITPWLAKTNVYLLLSVRIIEGVFEGVTYPSMHNLWSKWAPPLERTRLVSLAFTGSYVGTVVSMPICAYLAKTVGWPIIFYFFGSIGLIWFGIWWAVVAETPKDDNKISKTELKYIEESLSSQTTQKKTKHPWKQIVKSPKVWTIIVAHFSETWGFYTLLTLLPKFMKEMLNFDLGEAGFLSALPYLAMSIIIPISGFFADWLLEKKFLTTTQARKIFTCVGFICQTIFMLAGAFWMSPIGTILCLTLAVGLGGFAWSGFIVNYLDIAPQYAGVLMGFGNTFGTLPGILSPIIYGYIVTTPSIQEWQIIFYIASAIYLVGAIIYGTFATAKVQSWAVDEDEKVEQVTKEKF